MKLPWFYWSKLSRERSATGFSSEVIVAREAYLSGSRSIAELTATTQGAVSLWECRGR